MLKKITLFASLALVAPTTAYAEIGVVATNPPAPVDPARLAVAQKTVSKLIPPGTYKRIMKDVMDNMANGMVQQMMGLDASTIAGAAGDSKSASDVKGKTLGDLAAEKDPHFKERMDITMKVMFAEMGDIMNDMEPVVRDALSKIYARKYSVNELNDMNAFFATPSGAAFAANFMATFTDKEMMDASFGMMPKMMEAMPDIMKKVEAATAHLPPVPKAIVLANSTWPDCAVDGGRSDCSDKDKELAATTDAAIAAEPDPLKEIALGETADDPWYDSENWAVIDRKKVDSLGDKYDVLVAKSDVAYNKSDAAFKAWKGARTDAIDAARTVFKRKGWKPDPNAVHDKPMAAEDIPANAPPPPVLPKK